MILATCAVWLAATSPAGAVSCTVQTQAVDFGPYRTADAGAKTGRGEVRVSCTCVLLDCVAFGYNVNVLSGGSGSTSDRRMTRQEGGGDTLQYQLYSDSLYLSPWTAPIGQLYLLALFGGTQTIYVYGKAPSGQAIHTGTYKDNPGVVITY